MSLEDLLSSPKGHPRIWRGQAGGLGGTALATGFEALDRYLPDNGWPRGALTEIFVERYGSGELSLLMPALASLCRPEAGLGRWLVWIDPPFIPYAPALSRCGVDLDRVLLVHSSGRRKNALWAVEQTVRSGCSIAALAWLDKADDSALRRLQLGAEENGCWAVLFRPMSALGQRSPAAVRLRLARAGGATRIEIVKCRGRRPATIDIGLASAGTADQRSAEHGLGAFEWR